MHFRAIRTLLTVTSLVIAVQCQPQTTCAALIGLTSGILPDISSGEITVDYVYDALNDIGTFEAHGIAQSLQEAAQPLKSISAGSFDLSIEVHADGTVLPGGTLSIGGTVDGNGPTLLTGTISRFGYTEVAGENIFDFLFNVTGGDLATEIGPVAGVILASLTGLFSGNLEDEFHSFVPGAVADTFPAPEPTTAITWAVLCALGFCAARIKRGSLAVAR
jgi:hypothetical protein